MLSTRSNRLAVTPNGREALMELLKYNLKKKQESDDLLAAESLRKGSWKKSLIKTKGAHLFPRDTGSPSIDEGDSSARMPSAHIQRQLLNEQEKNPLVSNQFSKKKPNNSVQPPNKDLFFLKDANKTDIQRLYTTERQKLSSLGISTGLTHPPPDPNFPPQTPRHKRFVSHGDPYNIFGASTFISQDPQSKKQSPFRLTYSSLPKPQQSALKVLQKHYKTNQNYIGLDPPAHRPASPPAQTQPRPPKGLSYSKFSNSAEFLKASVSPQKNANSQIFDIERINLMCQSQKQKEYLLKDPGYSDSNRTITLRP
jgi:hypothetical protein